MYLKNALNLSVNVFSKKVLIEDKFYVFDWRWHRHFSWSSEPHQVQLAVCRAEEELSFLSYFKTLTIELCSQALYRNEQILARFSIECRECRLSHIFD